MKKRVLVVGGTGHIGRIVVEICCRDDTLDVWTGHRGVNGPRCVQIDLGNPNTFRAMNDFDVVIDCADTSRVSPSACMQHCLHAGQLFVETSAVPNVVKELLADSRSSRWSGTAIVSAGLFPGVSNVLARHAWSKNSDTLELAIRLNPFSESGAGTANLMARLLFSPAVCYEDGKRRQERPFSAVSEFPFSFGIAPAYLVGLAESCMLHLSLGAPNTSGFLSLSPSIVQRIAKPLSAFIPKRHRVQLAGEAVLRPLLRFMRTELFKGKATEVEISLVLDRNTPKMKSVAVQVNDGIYATGVAISAVVCVTIGRELQLPPGVHTLDEVVTLAELLEEMVSLGKPRLEIISRL